MLHRLETVPAFAGRARNHSSSVLVTFDELRRLELWASLACLRRLQRAEKRKQILRDLARYWPVGVGLVLACFAPWLRQVVNSCSPWGMRLVFPFVDLSGRPEWHLRGEVAAMLPQVMLYAQFPIEGLLAKFALKSRVSLLGVAGQLFYFHFLGAAQLWMVSGALDRFMAR
ncbi:MAG: hypothetical protein ABSE99_13605 [Terracidiphilus sp.]|jgi:hypothetical protein